MGDPLLCTRCRGWFEDVHALDTHLCPARPGASGGLVRAGRSDKYGQVFVERVGGAGFDDPAEPVAVLRAQDRFVLPLMRQYRDQLVNDPIVSDEQVRSVTRQVAAFERWGEQHPEKVRTPGGP